MDDKHTEAVRKNLMTLRRNAKSDPDGPRATRTFYAVVSPDRAEVAVHVRKKYPKRAEEYRKYARLASINKSLVKDAEVEAFPAGSRLCAGVVTYDVAERTLKFHVEAKKGLTPKQLLLQLRKLKKDLQLMKYEVHGPREDGDEAVDEEEAAAPADEVLVYLAAATEELELAGRESLADLTDDDLTERLERLDDYLTTFPEGDGHEGFERLRAAARRVSEELVQRDRQESAEALVGKICGDQVDELGLRVAGAVVPRLVVAAAKALSREVYPAVADDFATQVEALNARVEAEAQRSTDPLLSRATRRSLVTQAAEVAVAGWIATHGGPEAFARAANGGSQGRCSPTSMPSSRTWSSPEARPAGLRSTGWCRPCARSSSRGTPRSRGRPRGFARPTVWAGRSPPSRRRPRIWRTPSRTSRTPGRSTIQLSRGAWPRSPTGAVPIGWRGPVPR